MKKNDMILILVVLIVGIISYGIVNAIKHNDESNLKVIIKHKGVVVKEYAFTHETQKTYVLDSEDEVNVVQIKNGEVSVTEANCHDLICVKTGAISKPGEIIVCLPHKFTVEIVSNEMLNELDDIVE
ncbi:NusG domain II-containing protein [Fusibacter ferrireducens]|uniref:NusG domain II-containing protein n=1 Tax=Fusibacter ferrireducens TaxID=2785058 RepID=A0ABR9ZXV3_9FIRM|nr:NusG domain II-containing protein [Fusibacter ferrireducens]MBF4694786.1 NusG domain II-containing protein [Fusibacter ferrireducens]